jgi:hypothetical protein
LARPQIEPFARLSGTFVQTGRQQEFHCGGGARG